MKRGWQNIEQLATKRTLLVIAMWSVMVFGFVLFIIGLGGIVGATLSLFLHNKKTSVELLVAFSVAIALSYYAFRYGTGEFLYIKRRTLKEIKEEYREDDVDAFLWNTPPEYRAEIGKRGICRYELRVLARAYFQRMDRKHTQQ